MSLNGTTREGSGFLLILVATAIVGVCGYVITWLVPRTIGVAPYTVFAVFWAGLFLVVAALSGIQQETTRATNPRSPDSEPAPLAKAGVFAVGGAVLALLAILATSPLWVGAVFGGDWRLVWPLAIGCANYVLLAVLTGTLYGAKAWRAVFAVMTCEGVLRFVLVGGALLFTHDVVVLAWAVALPLPVTALAIWLATRSSIAGRTELDVGYRGLAWNSARTVVAAASMGLLVSGFPLVLSVTSPGEPKSELGLLILTATITRAPLIVVAMAMQSYLIVLFREAGERFWRLLVLLEGGALAAGVVLGALAWIVGPPIFEFLFPGQPVPAGWLIGVLVATSALVAALCISAPAVLSRGAHTVYTAGWVVAAIVTVAGLLLPLPLLTRASIALLVGPLAGLLVHVVYLVLSRNALPNSQKGTSSANSLRP